MSTGVYHAVSCIIVRQVVICASRVSGIESKFKDFHSGITAVIYKSSYTVCHISKIFRYKLAIAKTFFDLIKKLNTGSFFPMTACRSLILCRDGIIFIKSSEMIYSDNIIIFKILSKSLYPPFKTCISVISPIIKRISPKLSVRSKTVRRATGHRYSLTLFIHLKQFSVRPGVRTVHSHINRNIADNLYTVFIGICF